MNNQEEALKVSDNQKIIEFEKMNGENVYLWRE